MRIKVFAAAVAFSLSLPTFAQAKTIEFPKSGSEFSITFPDDWTASIQEPGIIVSAPKDGGFSFTVFPAEAHSAKKAFADTMKFVERRFAELNVDEPSEIELNDMKFYGGEATGKLKGNSAEMKSTIMTFSPDGHHYFALFSTGTPEADALHSPECLSILNSIKATKGEGKSEE